MFREDSTSGMWLWSIHKYTNIMDHLLTSSHVITRSIHQCLRGHKVIPDERTSTTCKLMILGPPQGKTMQKHFNDFSAPLSSSCLTCETPLLHCFLLTFQAPLLAVDPSHCLLWTVSWLLM
ncbi:hypothetical protein L208DRAFT_1558789 [Tricholoma matsutake]|nr:hypothetical protein L208DRAFT_1558789 [Tricholoma matsutake 945]